ncbi:uncharacterized protein LOC117603084 [Osmia lignaria lignaria]|uniref:uncharacterized protein LOC117603084 n=1 Tax=Osmia lignaria lignaria TaxID=1437193 RepID=UPI001478658E|nr:splicing regulatory glutamine/lysine-rich protein 1-like [Osmia lignaria]
MAPSKKGTRNWLGKKLVIEPRYVHGRQRKPIAVSRRTQVRQTINVPEMVYRLLNATKHNQGRGEDERIPQGRVRKYESLRESSYDSLPLHESTISVDGSKYTKSGATSTENTSRVMDATNSSEGSVSWNSSVSNISVEPITLVNTIDNTRALLKKKSLVQVINSYIKAGIEEGKRQAKKYIRKALSFGMKSGYLIPADRQGQVLHVSPTLVESRRSDSESRRRRRRTRRGEEEPFTDRKEHRKETPPWNTKRKRHREPTPSPMAPLKKRKKRSTSKNPESKVDTVKATPKKKPVESVRNKPLKKKNNAITKKRGKVTHTTLSLSSKEPREKVKSVEKTRSKHKNEVTERRRSRSDQNRRSPSTRNNEKENRKKERRGSSNEDNDSVKFIETEVNERTTTERRGSESSREDVPRDNDVLPGNPGKEVEEPLETPSNEDNALRNIN